MRRLTLIALMLAVFGTLSVLQPREADALSPLAPLVIGDVPKPDLIGLLVTSRATTAAEVSAELATRGCTVAVLGVVQSGVWQMYIPSAPAFVNAAFPGLAQSQAFYLRCAPGVTTQDSVVMASVTYLQKIALPPNAIITVTLQDISRADAPAIVIVEESTSTNGKQVPFNFVLVYNPAVIDSTHTYAVRARITVNGALWFTTDTVHSVITRGQPRHVDLVLVQVPIAMPTEPPTQIVERNCTWVTTTMADGSKITPNRVGDSIVTFKADGTVGIKTDCNSFFGTYALEMSKIVISPLGSTLMACPPNSMERSFVQALREVTTAAMIGDANTLVLSFPDGRGSMTFTAVPRPQPMGY